MATYHQFQHEIDKDRQSLTSMSMVNKTSRTVLEKLEKDLRQTLIKTRGRDEEKVQPDD